MIDLDRIEAAAINARNAAAVTDAHDAEQFVLCQFSDVLAMVAAIRAAQIVADSPAGKRYGFLGLITALEPFTQTEGAST